MKSLLKHYWLQQVNNVGNMRIIPLKNQSEDLLLLCVGTASSGTNTANLHHYQKFGLREITIYQNGFATAGTPISTTDNKRL